MLRQIKWERRFETKRRRETLWRVTLVWLELARCDSHIYADGLILKTLAMLSSQSTTWERAQCLVEKGGEHQLQSGRVHLIRNVSFFLSCAVVSALILCHLWSSSPQHHFQPLLLRFLYFPSTPCCSYYLYSDGFFHQLTPILKTPIPENSHYHNVWIYRWIMSDCWECCFPNMHQLVYMRWPIITASLASTGSHRFRMHVFFRDQSGRILVPSLASDGLALIKLPILDPAACHSWFHETAHFCPDYQVYTCGSEYIWRGTLHMLVFLWSSRPGLGCTDWSSRLQAFSVLGWWNCSLTCSDWIFPCRQTYRSLA